MTVRQKLSEMLTERGLWPQEAEEVLETLRLNEEGILPPPGETHGPYAPLVEVFEKSFEGYPESFLVTARRIVLSKAVQWIDKNEPQHFARPMFGEDIAYQTALVADPRPLTPAEIDYGRELYRERQAAQDGH